MSNELSTIDMSTFGQLAPSMRGALTLQPGDKSEFASGVTGGFAVVSILGKLWRTKYQGTENVLMRTATDPMSSIEVVLVRASPNLSKIFYPGAYTKGDDSPPDCYSTNGVYPAQDSTHKQSATCASCPQNAWGSKITENNKKAKACSDTRRMAVVPLNDIDNDALGGPMLLRVPPASLGELASFDAKMRGLGFPLYSIGVRVSFDLESEYQKLVYSAIRPLTEDEAQKILTLRDDERVARILSIEDINTPAAADQPAQPAEQVFEQPPATPVVAPAPAAKALTKKTAPAASASAGGFGGGFSAGPATPATPQVKPDPKPTAEIQESTEHLDDMLNNLLPE